MISNDSASVYTDFSGFNELRASARKDSGGTLKEVARQFEGMFLQMMLKSMRSASLGEGILDNNQTGMVRDMYDQQLALSLAGQSGIGLAAAFERQLGAQAGITPVEETAPDNLHRFESQGDIPMPLVAGLPTQSPILPAKNDTQVDIRSPDQFVNQLMPLAKRAADKLGADAEVLVAQAALESGWGKSVIRNGDGSNSHNLFGIKADASWKGDRAWVNTLEYEGGVPVKKREPFRAYESYEQSFSDYAQFISNNPRYKQALEVAENPKAYTQGLQDAGYATDPKYAQKIMKVLDGSVMSSARANMG